MGDVVSTKIRCNQCFYTIESRGNLMMCLCGSVYLDGDHVMFREDANVEDLSMFQESVISIGNPLVYENEEMRKALQQVMNQLNFLMRAVENVPCSKCHYPVGHDWALENVHFYCPRCKP